jgi:hypothetical protein
MSFALKQFGKCLLPVPAVLGLALLSQPAMGAERLGPKGEPEPQAVSDLQLAESIHLLQSIKKSLEMADHDYGGHRADAVRDIGAAERQLRRALERAPHRARGTVGPRAGGTGNSHAEPQALSDAQLAAAVPTLKATAEALHHADHDYGGHRVAAMTDLREAIRQLETALAYSKRHDQNKP